MYEYLYQFGAARNTGVSAALGELASVILHCRTDKFSLLLCVCGACCRRGCLMVAP